MEEKTNNLVAKHARKYNKAAVHKDRKKAQKKGDRKHKGKQYEDIGNVDEVFTSTAISNFFKKSGDKKKYDKVVADIKKGKYSVAKASQIHNLDGRILQSMVSEWSCNTSETSRRVQGGDKRKSYMKEKDDKDKDKKKENPRRKSDAVNSLLGRRRQMRGRVEGVEEGDKKGLWDRIHAKRKRGEKPAKPGDKDYPKTLDVDEGLKQARKNVGSDSCWDGYKAKGTKMKGGKEVPDCQKETKARTHNIKMRDFVKQMGKNQDVNDKEVQMHLRNLTKKKNKKESVEEGTSAQSRLDKMAAKHGLGKPNKAADDYLAKMMKKYGAKDMADLKKKMGMKEETINELTKREQEMLAKRKQTNLVKRGKAKAEPKKPRQKDRSAGKTVAKQSGDDHLVMQLRKAQDVKGNMDIKVTPSGKTVKLPIKMIDKLLATHDNLQKPDEKRKFRILVTKELRKRAK